MKLDLISDVLNIVLPPEGVPEYVMHMWGLRTSHYPEMELLAVNTCSSGTRQWLTAALSAGLLAVVQEGTTKGRTFQTERHHQLLLVNVNNPWVKTFNQCLLVLALKGRIQSAIIYDVVVSCASPYPLPYCYCATAVIRRVRAGLGD